MALIGTRVPLPAEPVVHHVFADHARTDPDRLALVCGDQRRTYGELNAAANRFARYLIARGIGPGSLVGVCLDRSPELMTTILGVLKSGAAYVPLDPAYPGDRLKLMISQLEQMKLVAAAPSTIDLVRDSAGEALDVTSLGPEVDALSPQDPEVAVTGDDLCYAVFTSGSTGTPKATAVRHEGWFNLLAWLQVEYDLDAHSSNLMLSSFGFDISQRSLMAPLFTGAALHLLPSRSFDLALAYRIIGEHGIRTLHCAPSTLYLLVERDGAGGALTGLDYVFIGGEPLAASRVERWARRPGNRCLLLHQYGVAECTDVASSFRMTDFDAYRGGAPLPAGEPVYNTRIHIVDEALSELPDGEVGEICVSGTSVGAGYLNATAADQARFTTARSGGEQVRLYRTGDHGYTTPDGRLVVVGRLDAQVKIRGMRIDLGDVEHAIDGHPAVRQNAVVAAPDGSGELELVAFVVAEAGAAPLDVPALRRELARTLPRNMVPQRVVVLPALPLNPNGKIDRKVLNQWAQTESEPVAS